MTEEMMIGIDGSLQKGKEIMDESIMQALTVVLQREGNGVAIGELGNERKGAAVGRLDTNMIVETVDIEPMRGL